MLYFIPWVVFLLFMILLVPIAAMIEKRKNPALAPEYDAFGDDPSGDDGVDEFAGDGDLQPLEDGADGGFGNTDDGFGNADDGFGNADDGFGNADDGFGDVAGGEDFSAFDEEFS